MEPRTSCVHVLKLTSYIRPEQPTRPHRLQSSVLIRRTTQIRPASLIRVAPDHPSRRQSTADSAVSQSVSLSSTYVEQGVLRAQLPHTIQSTYCCTHPAFFRGVRTPILACAARAQSATLASRTRVLLRAVLSTQYMDNPTLLGAADTTTIGATGTLSTYPPILSQVLFSHRRRQCNVCIHPSRFPPPSLLAILVFLPRRNVSRTPNCKKPAYASVRSSLARAAQEPRTAVH